MQSTQSIVLTSATQFPTVQASSSVSVVHPPIVNSVVAERDHFVTVRVPEVIREIFVPVDDSSEIVVYQQQIKELEETLRLRNIYLADLQMQNEQKSARINDLLSQNTMLAGVINQRNGEVNHLIRSTSLMEQSKIPVKEIVTIETIITKPVIIENVVERVIEKPVFIDHPVEVAVTSHVIVPIERQVDRPIVVEQLVDKPVAFEREILVEQVVRRPVDVPRLIEKVNLRDVHKPVVFEQQVNVPVDVPVIYEVPRPVDRPVLFEQVTQVLVDVPVPVEQPVIYEIDKPVDVPRIYESVVERGIPIDRPVLYESVVERLVDRPVFHDVMVTRPVIHDVVVETLKPVAVDAPVILERSIAVPVPFEKQIFHPRIVDVPVITPKIVERPILVETVRTSRLSPIPDYSNPFAGTAPVWAQTTKAKGPVSPVSVQENDPFDTVSTNDSNMRRSICEPPRILKKSNEFKLRPGAPMPSQPSNPMNYSDFGGPLAPMATSFVFDAASNPFRNRSNSPFGK